MKQVTISGKYIAGSWILIDSTDTLLEYMEYTSEKVVDQTKRLIKSGAGIERWDHMITKSHEGSILAATIIKCKAEGKNPILEMDGIIQQKFMNMFENLQKGRQLLVNELGGYCFMHEDYIIESEKILDIGFKPTHVINEGTQFINLENDPELENRTKEYLGAIDANYSYVLNLHKYTQSMLVDVFTEFKAKGGKVVHVYTTGMNVPQMYDYFEAAQLAGLNDFEFEFNAGISKGIREFINHANSLANVKIIE